MSPALPRWEPSDTWVQCEAGHEHWGALGAAGLLIRHVDDQGVTRYLLQHRGPYVDHPNTWSIPGGARHRGEDAIDAAIREAVEEMGALPEMAHVATYVDDHGGWAYVTVVVEAADLFAPASLPGATGHEQHGAQWVAADDVADLALHPGFAATWPRVSAPE